VLSVAVPVGLVMSLAVTWSSTYAAFSASTGNGGNSWQAGSVDIADSDSGSALFTTNSAVSPNDSVLQPGSSRSRCIQINYTGSLEADIRMYVGAPVDSAPAPADATGLDPYLVMSVERGMDGALVPEGAPPQVAPNCDGFTSTNPKTFLYNTQQANVSGASSSRTLADLRGTHKSYATGIKVNEKAKRNTYMTLRITYVLADDNEAQSKQSSATFTWEAQNTPLATQGTP